MDQVPSGSGLPWDQHGMNVLVQNKWPTMKDDEQCTASAAIAAVSVQATGEFIPMNFSKRTASSLKACKHHAAAHFSNW